MLHIPAEALVERAGMHQRIDVEIFRAGPGMEITAVRRKVRFGFVRPQRIVSLADNVVANNSPIPFGGVGIRRIAIALRRIVLRIVRTAATGRVLGIITACGDDERNLNSCKREAASFSRCSFETPTFVKLAAIRFPSTRFNSWLLNTPL